MSSPRTSLHVKEIMIKKKRKLSDNLDLTSFKKMCRHFGDSTVSEEKLSRSLGTRVKSLLENSGLKIDIPSFLVHLQNLDTLEMDKDKIAKLTNDELQEHLLKYVSKVPPLTDTTRELCENLLSKHVNGIENCDSMTSAFIKPDCIKVISDQPKIEPSDVYYSVCTSQALDSSDASQFIYTEKLQALGEFKKHKGARFKAFQSYDDALKFAQAGSSVLNVSIDPRAAAVKEEKPSLFPSPAPQQHIKFRKAIEKGDPVEFELFVNTNPRYLVSKADTPSILKEGPRYNALHVACLANKSIICQKILDAVSSSSLFEKLYPMDPPESHEQRSIRLLDLYLNTPDKGSHRTPLHYAAVFGFIECVTVLVSYPGCGKQAIDKFGKTPLEIAGTRSSNNNSDVQERIAVLLGDHFYVPLLKDEEECFSPKVCPPMSPSQCNNIESIFPLSNKHMSPSYKIQGYAGPMNAQKSKHFYNKLRPPIALSPVRTPKLNTSSIETVASVGRKLAEELGTLWTEYWPFLEDFVDIRSEDGLQRLESHLQLQLDQVIKERYRDPELLEEETNADDCSMESGGKNPPKDNQTNASAVSSIALLCMELEALRLNRSVSPTSSPVKSIFEVTDPQSFVINYENNNIEDYFANDELSVYNYALRSACVTGRKLASVLMDFLECDFVMVNTASSLRSFNSKLRPEISSLLTVITRIPLKDPSDFRFVHPVAATHCLEVLMESKMASDFLKLSEIMESLDRQGYLFDEECSEDEDYDQPPPSARNIPHRNCMVKLLLNGLKTAHHISTSLFEDAIDWKLLGNCTCQWWSENTTQEIRVDVFSSPEARRVHQLVHNVLYGECKGVSDKSDDVARRLSFSDEEYQPSKGEDDEESFVSACTSLDDNESLVTPDEVIPYYIYGSSPNIEDIDLLAALRDKSIDEQKYPRIFDWRKLVAKLDQRGVSSKHKREDSFAETSTQPVRGPSFCSTPDLMQRTFKMHLMASPQRNSPR